MTRKLARVISVDAISPIDGADNIEVAAVGGWNVVVKKGKFKVGETGLFFEIDSSLPYDDPRYAFLRARCTKQWKNNGEVILRMLRLKTMKLHGVVSQGLLLPLAAFPEIRHIPPGEDVSALLGVRHIDDIAEEMSSEMGRQLNRVPAWFSFRNSQAVIRMWRLYTRISHTLLFPRAKKEAALEGSFPSFIPKTNVKRLQNHTKYFSLYRDTLFEVTAKADGSSMTCIWTPSHNPGNPFIVCSRNMNKGSGTGADVFSEAARLFNIREKMERHRREIAIQGELVGPGRNGNRDKYDSLDFQVFRIWDIGRQAWLTPEERYRVCEDLDLHHVQILSKAEPVFRTHPDMASMLKYAEGKTPRGNEREGIVCKSLGGAVSFKVISNKYLLAAED